VPAEDLVEGNALVVSAAVRLDRDGGLPAVAPAEHALAAHRETGHLLGQAHAHLILGNALEKTGRADAAAGHRGAAHAILADLGVGSLAQ
jgi:hypothetical protein